MANNEVTGSLRIAPKPNIIPIKPGQPQKTIVAIKAINPTVFLFMFSPFLIEGTAQWFAPAVRGLALRAVALGRRGLCLEAKREAARCHAARNAPKVAPYLPVQQFDPRAAVRSMALLGRESLPGLGVNTSKHFREQEENDGTCRPPTENTDKDCLCRRDRKPCQSRET
jgi:hypothetical protein